MNDSEAENVTLPATPAPLSPDNVLASSDYTLDSDSDSKPFKEEPQEENLEESFEDDPSKDESSDEDPIETDEPLQAQTALTPFTQPPLTRLLPAIFAIVLQPGQEIPFRRPYSIMPTSHTSVTSRARLFISYIILFDFEDEDATLHVAYAPSSPDRMSISFGYSSNSDSDSKPTEEDSSDEDLIETAESH
nr:hypothetical protein [Tanacetum cinerariifolium]